MDKVVNRKRPRLSRTVAPETLAVLFQVANDMGLPNLGVALDVIVHDWVTMKSAALAAAAPSSPTTISDAQ